MRQNSKLFSALPPIPHLYTPPLFTAKQLGGIKTFLGLRPDFVVSGVDLATVKNLSGDELRGLVEFYLQRQEDVFAGFKSAKRGAEWLAGRIAAKSAVLALRPDIAAEYGWQVQIYTDAAGRPFCQLPGRATEKMPDISITHSGSIAAALAFSCLCGIDFQKINPTVARVKSRFAIAAEQQILCENNYGLSETALLTILWSVKEAVRKAFPRQPLPGFMQLQLQCFEARAGGFSGHLSCRRRDMPAAIPFFCIQLNDYAGAVVLR
ncbi:MAG: 4'-phosphopantetheinyl transferase superfamily protein [Deltaproteobacteria bacterium]|nr:4'-phosphopantetheinyl transferase superfamily protein [Deltaproteobacteria bacterium]